MQAKVGPIFASMTFRVTKHSQVQVPSPPQLVGDAHWTEVSPYAANSAAATLNVSANATDT